MRKPMTPDQAAAEFERKQAARERAAKRVAKGLPPLESRISGDHELRYQEELEKRAQMRIPGC